MNKDVNAGSSGVGGSSSSSQKRLSSFKAYDHLDPTPQEQVFSAYDHLVPPEESPYAALGDIEEVDLTSFAYQIASGMVGHTEALLSHTPLNTSINNHE